MIKLKLIKYKLKMQIYIVNYLIFELIINNNIIKRNNIDILVNR